MLSSSNRKYMLYRKLNYFFSPKEMISNGSFHHVSAWHALLGIQHSPHANGFLVVTYGYPMLLLFRLKRLYHLWFFLYHSKRPQYCGWGPASYCVFAEFCQRGMNPPPTSSIRDNTCFLVSFFWFDWEAEKMWLTKFLFSSCISVGDNN